MAPHSAEYVRRVIEQTGALVVGRRVYDSLGRGIRFFGELSQAPVLLDDPMVIEGTRVTHLRFRVRRRNG